MGKLSLRGIERTFDQENGKGLAAVGPLSLEIEDKEFLCMLGPSGCGKTTLLRIIAGLERASAGEVFLDGVRIQEPNPRIGMVFQEYSLFPWRTVWENIVFGPEMNGVPAPGRRIIAERYLALVGLEQFRDNYPAELSGGMKQRVAIARALANEPEVLLMDEPFGALDAQTRNRMQHELLQIWEKAKKTIIFITHSVDEAVFLADRIVVLTRRPGTIREVLPVIHCHPRDRTCAESVMLRKHVLDLITEESSSPSKV